MDAQRLRPPLFPHASLEGTFNDACESQKEGLCRGVGSNDAVISSLTQRQQAQQQSRQGLDRPAAYAALQLYEAPMPYQQGHQTSPLSENTYGREGGPAPPAALNRVYARVQGLEPEFARNARQHLKKDMPGGVPLHAQPIESIINRPSLGPGAPFQCVTPARRTFGLKPDRCGPLPPTLHVLSAARAAVAPAVTPTPAAARETIASTAGSSGIGIPTAVHSSRPLRVRPSISNEGHSSDENQVSPHYWVPPVSRNNAAAIPRCSRIEAVSGVTAAACGDAARLSLPRASGFCGGPAAFLTAPTAPVTTVEVAAAKRGCAKRSVASGGSVSTRRQAAAAALAEVVRIDDSSDEEGPAALPEKRPQGPPPLKVLAVTNGPPVPQRDGNGLGASDALPGLLEGASKMPRERLAAYIVFVAAVVEGNGRCCLLSTETILKAAAQSGEWDHHQQQRSSSNSQSAAAAVPAADSAKCVGSPANHVLVVQAHQDERMVSLDIWRPPTLSSASKGTEHGAVPEGVIGLPDSPFDEDSLYNLFSFPSHSVHQLRRVNLCAESSHFSSSGSSSSSSSNSSTNDKDACGKTVCRRCGCGRNRVEVDRGREATGRERKHKPSSGVSEEKGAATATANNKRSKRSGGKLDSSHPEKAAAMPFSGLIAWADAAASGPLAIVPQSPTVSTAEDKLSDKGETTPEVRKNENEEVIEKRRSRTHKSNGGKPRKSESLKAALKTSSTSRGHHRHSKSRINKTLGRHNGSKRSRSMKDARERRSSSSRTFKAETHTVSRAPSGYADPGAAASNTPTTEIKEQLQGLPTPRNALIVTGGRPMLGGSLEVHLNEDRGVAADTRVLSYCSCGNSDNSSEVKDASEKNKITYCTCGSSHGIASRVRDKVAETSQHASESHSTIKNSSARNRKGRHKKHTTREKLGTRRSNKQSQRDKRCLHDEAKGDNCSSSNCRSGCGSEATPPIFSGGPRAVAVLCLELQQSQAGELHYSKLLQRLLESHQGPTCDATSLKQGEQQMKEDSQAVTLRTSTALAPTQTPYSHRSTSKHMSSQVHRSCNSSSSSSKRVCESPRRSKDRLEENLAVTHQHRSSGSSNHSPHRRFRSGKRHHSSILRHQPKSCSSSSRKRRREASSSTTATASDGCAKAFSNSYVLNMLPQRETCSDSSSSCCKQERIHVAWDVSINVHNSKKMGGVPSLPQEVSSNTDAPIGNSAPKGGPIVVNGVPTEKEQKFGEYLPESHFAQGHKSGLWLMLCVGPPLQVGAAGNDTKAAPPKEGPNDCSIPLLKSVGHSPPISFSVTSRSSCSSSSEQPLPKREDAALSCSKHDFLALWNSLLSGTTASPPPHGWAGVLDGQDECMDISIGALARYITQLAAEPSSRGSSVACSFEGKHARQISGIPLCLVTVLDAVVARGYGPWEAMGESSGLASDLPLESLRHLWRERSLRGPKEASLVTTGDGHRPELSCQAGPTATSCAKGKEEAARTREGQAAATSPPVFDLLLDDKTLRRLSGKEFLDDTIIDFCLGFIVDHILTPEERVRVHISNTFFLSALMAQICEVEGHSRLTRWLKKELTPLPRKDFIFIPVHHEHQHWSLAVVVFPWRAVNPISKNARTLLDQAPVVPLCKTDTNDQRGDSTVLRPPVAVFPPPTKMDETLGRVCTEGYLLPSNTKRRVGQDGNVANGSGKSGGPHVHRGSQPKARMFHVDSMGLRSVFDQCRGRLKRFLRREFEYRCGGLLRSGESAELCTESCCWQDGLSCNLHTPRQQNGYDCGVFVVEYVLFLTRNLNAIEALLSGPSRDSRSHHYASCSPQADVAMGPLMAKQGSRGHSEIQAELGNRGKLLETTLGFSCPCMAVGDPKREPKGHDSQSTLSVTVKARLAELRRAKALTMAAAATKVSTQDQLLLHHSLHPAPLRGPQEAGSAVKGSVVCRREEPLHLSSVRPFGAFNTQEKSAFVESSQEATVLAAPLQVPFLKTSTVGCEDTTASPSSATVPFPRVSPCPPWGPLPHSVSKRRSAHTKWFSQDRVTQRRSQLHKMLLVMRENTLWQGDPKLVAHLKSLFLGVENS